MRTTTLCIVATLAVVLMVISMQVQPAEAKNVKLADMIKKFQTRYGDADAQNLNITDELKELSAAVKDYFNVSDIPTSPDHLRDVTPEQFFEYSTRGVPVVVQDCVEKWDAKDWTCQSLRDEFPNSTVEAWGSYDGRKEKLAYKMSDPFLDNIMPLNNRADDKSPTLISWYWYPISGSGDTHNETEVARKLLKNVGLPYFITPTPENVHVLTNRMELFMGSKGSGAAVHADEVCEYIFSAQIRGQKRWRLGLPTDVELLRRKHQMENNQSKAVDSDFEDMLINSAVNGQDGGENIYDFVMNPGDVVFFPPGMVHETRGVSDGCSLSISLQFNDPPPVKYLKAFKKRLLYGPAKSCFYNVWYLWMFGEARPQSDSSPRANRMEATSLFYTLDADEDEKVTKEEVRAYFTKLDLRDEEMSDAQYELALDRHTNNFMLFQDEDNKGFVTLRDLVRSWKQWTSRDVEVLEEMQRREEEEGSDDDRPREVPQSSDEDASDDERAEYERLRQQMLRNQQDNTVQDSDEEDTRGSQADAQNTNNGIADDDWANFLENEGA